MTTIGLAIPSIPPRRALLARALTSVCMQHRLPDQIAVAVDVDHDGAAITRNRAWRSLGHVDYVAFLDDDDELYPHHLAMLLDTALSTGADLVYPWFEVIGGTDPFPPHFATDAWDPVHPRQTTVTVLWRRDTLEEIAGFPEVGYPGDVFVPELGGITDETGNYAGEEFRAVLALNRDGGKIVHVPEVTWAWHHDSGNTSGRPDRW